MPELPPPLPPAERTVGQFVGETIRAYGAHFWRALPLGVPLAIATRSRSGAARRADDRLARVLPLSARRTSTRVQPRPRGAADRCRRSRVRYSCSPCRSCFAHSCFSRVLRGSRCSGSPCRRRWSSARLPRGARARTQARDRRLRARARLARRTRDRRRDLGADADPRLLRTQGDNGQRLAPRGWPTSCSVRCSTSAAHCSISTRRPV